MVDFSMGFMPGAAFFTAGAGQNLTAANSDVKGSSKGADARDTFLEFMAKSTTQKIHELMLKHKGLTEEQYQALSPEERAKIDAEIEERLKREAERQVGVIGV